MVPGVDSPAGAAGRKRLHILVAGTSDAIDELTRMLSDDADIVPARSVSEALLSFHPGIDVVCCNVRFDESRMFDFLLALRQRPGGAKVRVVSFRITGAELAPRMRTSIRSALEALGVETFIDIPQLTEQYGGQIALETLRQVLLRGGV
jgi:hypothetical protein